jgi:hypothetical protein
MHENTNLTISPTRTDGITSTLLVLASAHAQTIVSTMRSTASRHVLAPASSFGAADSTMNVLPSARRMRAGSVGRALNAAKLVLVTSSIPVTVSWDGDGDEGGGTASESMRERREEVLDARESDAGRCFVGDDVGNVEGAEIEHVRPGDMLERGERALRLVGDVLDWLVNLLVLPGDMLGPVGKVGRSILLRME